MTEKASENPVDCDAMMKSMIEMIPKMMSQCGEQDLGKMQNMMAKMKGDDPAAPASQMPEMMLKMMVPHCIGMMMPKIEADKRGEAATAILATIIAKGTDGMSDEQMRGFHKSLEEVLHRST